MLLLASCPLGGGRAAALAVVFGGARRLFSASCFQMQIEKRTCPICETYLSEATDECKIVRCEMSHWLASCPLGGTSSIWGARRLFSAQLSSVRAR